MEEFRQGKTITPAFPRVRPSYDSFLTMHNRTIRDFDREEHIRNLARLGFSHAEVNGLAFAVPFERGPVGEVLHRFYTYCPALDQFVTSRLNRGYYDRDYLQANLNFLKTNAALAEKYGLSAGMTCFDPGPFRTRSWSGIPCSGGRGWTIPSGAGIRGTTFPSPIRWYGTTTPR